jgi:predicted metal-dependent phosphoesterase TrpH
MSIDLHIHSNFSDGAFSPSELVSRALQQGVDTIAIADHDSVSGVAEALAAGCACGVMVIPAVELSVEFAEWQDIHLLGYGIDCTDSRFLDELAKFRQRRASRNDVILDRVNEKLTDEGHQELDRVRVHSFARDAIGRPHIARALVERGYASCMEDAFKRYLVPCNVPKYYWGMHEAITEIHRIGGVAVLAHPTSITKDTAVLTDVMTKLQACELDGIEVYNNMGWALEIEFLRRFADDSGLLKTAGSDFHGSEEGLEIGRGREGMRFDHSLLAPLYEQIQLRRTAR